MFRENIPWMVRKPWAPNPPRILLDSERATINEGDTAGSPSLNAVNEAVVAWLATRY